MSFRFDIGLIVCFIGMWWVFAPRVVNAQVSTFEDAVRLFDQGNCAEAYPYFRKQAGLFPKEPKYQYYCGACLVLMHASPDKALANLLYAADRPVPRDVYFFLGQLYLSQYQFTEAKEAFDKFRKFAKKDLLKKWDADLSVRYLENAQKAVSFKTEVTVLQADTLSQTSLVSFINSYSKQGKWVEKKHRNMLMYNGYPSYYFQPEHPDGVSPVFEPEQTRTGTIDLIAKFLKEKPYTLGSLINTPHEEGFAWFSTSTSTLYYATNGLQTMGGFDIFRSVYNPDTRLWSVPEMLGFPINSAADDFMFMFDEEQQMAWFASNRGVPENKVVVYTIEYSDNMSIVPLPKNSQFKLIARLIPDNKGLNTLKGDGKKTSDASKSVIKNSPIVVRPEQAYPSELSSQTEYNELISSALKVQVHGDSLARAANQLRQKLPQIISPVEQEKCRKNISWLEFRAHKTQLMADSLYEKARSYEQRFAIRDTRKSTGTQLLAKTTFQKNRPEQEASPHLSSEALVYDFKIVARSPYKTQDDIPMDQPIPEGVIYRIQMGAFSQPIEPERFKGIVPLVGENLREGTIKKYYAGNFSRNNDAEKALNKVREYGFKDAYIVSYYNGKTIPVSRAKDLEKNQ